MIEAGADVDAEHLHSVVGRLLLGFDRVCAYGFSKAYRYIAEAEAAVTKGYLEAMRALLDAGADVNAKVDGLTPLHRCVLDGHMIRVNLDIARALIEAGAGVDENVRGTYR